MLLDEISAHDIADQVNIMVFSDHGMTAIDELHKINISKALDMDEIKAISEAMTTVALWPQDGLEEKVKTDCIVRKHACAYPVKIK